MTDTLIAHSVSLQRPKAHVDYGLLLGLVVLGFFGAFMTYSATRQALINAGYSPHYYLERQTAFVLFGIAAMAIIARIDYRRLEILATPLYIFSFFALAGVFVVGKSALGAQRWYSFGALQIQPSEFTVLFIILAVATFCGRRSEGLRMYDVVRLLIMAAAPLGLIVLQPDLGTSIIIVLVVAGMMVVAGIPPRFLSVLTIVGSAGLVAAVYLDLLKKYQVDRFISFLNQNSTNPNITAILYEVHNAKSAIGAGGLWGAGAFKGLQTVLGFVPEQRTDFIFTAIGEQLGFVGAASVIVLLGFIAWRMWVIGRHAKDMMGRLLCIGIFIFFSFSCFENIGMTMGIMPVTGIPLPLLSYGGSAALVFFSAGGLVLSVSRRQGG
jgi:rod shape determining protein RodA